MKGGQKLGQIDRMGGVKFQTTSAFWQNLKSSYPNQISPLYAIVTSKQSEQKQISQGLIDLFSPKLDILKASSLKEALTHLQSSCFFKEGMGAYLANAQLLTKKETQWLIQYLKGPLSPMRSLILSYDKAASLLPIYKQAKSQMVILDLSAQKPWEEADRLKEWMFRVLNKEKKRIDPKAVDFLLENCKDRLCLSQEINKLVTFIGKGETISLYDVHSLCVFDTAKSPFFLADQILWQGNYPSLPLELAEQIPLAASLRSQLQTGLKMASLMDQGVSKLQIEKAFPKLWKRAFDLRFERARQMGVEFFKEGLIELFKVEVALREAKSKQGNRCLLALFCASLNS